MHSLISKWTILPGKESIVIKALKQLAVKVLKEEPDTLMYTVHTHNAATKFLPNYPSYPVNEIVFFEIYQDEAAFKAHVSGPIFTNFVKKFGKYFLSTGKDGCKSPYTTLEQLNHVAGFIRKGID